MSIRKIIETVKRRYTDVSIFKKVFLIYLLCGFLPMILSIIVFYNYMGKMLLHDAYDSVQQNMVSAQDTLEKTLQPYQTLMEILKNDKSLHIQLNMSYRNSSYVELAEYAETNLENMMAMYPDLTGIHFYCSNASLPHDAYYFYGIEELDSVLKEKLYETSDNIILYSDPKDKDSFVMVSMMNYYTTGGNRNYLEFQISKSLLETVLSGDAGKETLLLGDSGTILLNADGQEGYEEIQEYLPEWETLQEDSIKSLHAIDGKTYVCMSSDAGKGLKLLIMKDQSTIINDVRLVPLRLIIIFLVLLVLNSIFAFLMSKNLNKRLNRIQMGMKAIGEGHFEEKIEDMGEDEFGKIAADVNRMGTQIDELIQENYEKQLMIKSTELNLLQEQINPHFLYNALAVISSLSMQENGRKTVQCIRQLADFYRISLNKGRKVIHVREEIALLNNYMKIQLLRFSDYVEIDYQVAPEVEDYYTIKLLLQPLVENAIHHARDEEVFLSIHIRAYGMGDNVCFDVEDNGSGIRPDKLEKLQQELQRQEEGFGIKNVDKRIKLAYGQKYGVSIFSEQGKGTRIHIEIPKMTERGANS